MKVAIMQPYFFPYLGYWQMLNAVDIFVLYDDVNYINRGWINRNQILINKNPHMLTLPLLEASQNKLINTINITNIAKQKEKIIKTLNLAYAKAPYFNKVMPLLEEIILCKNSNLASFLKYQFEIISDYLTITTKLIPSSSICKPENLHGKYKILEICKILNAEYYINAIGGQHLYDKQEFEYNNIQLNFIKMNNIQYKQFNNKFVPNLSIIDVMMLNSLEQIKKMLDEYTLI